MKRSAGAQGKRLLKAPDAVAAASMQTVLWFGLLQAAPAAPSWADPPAGGAIVVEGRVQHPARLTMDQLKTMPSITIEVTYEAGHGEPHARFSGVLLWSLIGAASPIDEPGGRTFLRHTILARGADGYAVSLAIGEIVPGFEAKQVLVATAQDGKPLAAPRLVVPLDAKAGRSVKDLVAIEVR